MNLPTDWVAVIVDATEASQADGVDTTWYAGHFRIQIEEVTIRCSIDGETDRGSNTPEDQIIDHLAKYFNVEEHEHHHECLMDYIVQDLYMSGDRVEARVRLTEDPDDPDMFRGEVDHGEPVTSFKGDPELAKYPDGQLAWFLSLRDAIVQMDDIKLRTIAEIYESGLPGWKSAPRSELEEEVLSYMKECELSYDELRAEIDGSTTEKEQSQ